MEKIVVKAKTVDEAITKALIQLGTSSDKLEYEVVDGGSAGFLGFGARQAVIKAGRKEEEELTDDILGILPSKGMDDSKTGQEEMKRNQIRPEVRENAPERQPIDEEAAQQKVRQFLDDVFKAMGMEVQVDIRFNQKERELDIELTGQEMGVLIGKRGQTLDSLQYLISLVANKDHEGYLRVKLDTENYRERRKETLETLAKNIAYKVKRTRRPVALEPMNPYERRIIHSALQHDKYVITKSEGEEPFRHVVVVLKRDGREGQKKDRY